MPADFWAALSPQMKLPDSYVIIDWETTGWKPENDFPVDIGYAVVEDRKLARFSSVLLNWADAVPEDVIKERLARITAKFAEKGELYPYSYEHLSLYGIPAVKGLKDYMCELERASQDGFWVCGHNILSFDLPWIDYYAGRVLEHSFNSGSLTVCDTAMIEKALQLDRLPWVGETMQEWFEKVNNMFAPKGCSYNLPRHCQGRYKLATERELRESHSAGWDCVMVYRLMETYRELLAEGGARLCKVGM